MEEQSDAQARANATVQQVTGQARQQGTDVNSPAATGAPGAASLGATALPPLHAAAKQGDLQAVQELLLASAGRPAALDARCPEGLAPLHYAAGGGFFGIVWALRDAGANMAATYGSGLTVIHAFATHATQHRTPDAPRQLAALLHDMRAALGGTAALAALLRHRHLPSPLHLLLLQPHGKGIWQPRYDTADLVRLLVGAGCRVDAPLSESHPGVLITEWLRGVVAAAGDGDPWRRRITHQPTLAVASALLRCAADSAACTAAAAEQEHGRHAGHTRHSRQSMDSAALGALRMLGAEYLALAVRSGSTELVKCVLEAFPEAAAWEGQPTRSPISLALSYLHPLPPQEHWMGQYVRRVLHWCEMARALLAAGCQPVALRIKPAPASSGRAIEIIGAGIGVGAGVVSSSGGGSIRSVPSRGGVGVASCAGVAVGLGQCPLVAAPSASVELPAWAVEPFSFLPLVAAGLPWSEDHHPAFPPAFREAAAALLLANHRLSQTARAPWLPREVLGRVLGLAAAPLPAWSPQLRTFLA